MSKRLISRRAVVAGGVAAAGLAGMGPRGLSNSRGADIAPKPAAPNPQEVAFFHIGDTHFLASKDDPSKIEEKSSSVNERLINLLNHLPGTSIPEEAGGGSVALPHGVIHAGDLIDSGDKTAAPFLEMQKTELAAYHAHFGLTGSDGKLKYPVYEVHGNHDAPQGAGLVIDDIIRRNKTRPGVTNISANGLHYSWDWNGVHFANLGIVVGASPATRRKRRYNPLGSFDFLVADLKEKVGTSGRPVVLTHHVDVARYGQLPDNPDGPYESKEWDPVDVHAFHDALKPYNVVAILYGHTHARNVFKWDGSSTKAKAGLDVFNVKDASHYIGPRHTIFYFHMDMASGQMTVREYATTDNWKTGAWTPEVWKKEIKVAKA